MGYLLALAGKGAGASSPDPPPMLDSAPEREARAGTAFTSDGNGSFVIPKMVCWAWNGSAWRRKMQSRYRRSSQGVWGYLIRTVRHNEEKSHPFPSEMSLSVQVMRVCSLNCDSSWRCFKIHLQVTSSRQAGCHQLWFCHFISTRSHSCGKILERPGLWSAQVYFWLSPFWRKVISHMWLFSNYHLLRHTPWLYYKENQVASTYLQVFILRRRNTVLIGALSWNCGDSLESHFFWLSWPSLLLFHGRYRKLSIV